MLLYLPKESVPPVVGIGAAYGCDNCRKAEVVCEVNLFTGQTCARCKGSKIRCSFRQVTSKTLRTYLMWRMWKFSERNEPHHDFLPAHFKTPGATPPDWWIEMMVEPETDAASTRSEVVRGRARSRHARSVSKRRSKTPTSARAGPSRKSRRRSGSSSASETAPSAVRPKRDLGSQSVLDIVTEASGRTTRSRKGKERDSSIRPVGESTASPLLEALHLTSRTATPAPPSANPTIATPAPTLAQVSSADERPGLSSAATPFATSEQSLATPVPAEPAQQPRSPRRLRADHPQLLMHSEGITRSLRPSSSAGSTATPTTPTGPDSAAQTGSVTSTLAEAGPSSRQILRVPKIDGSWRTLPALNQADSTGNAEVSGLDYPGAPPANYTLPRNWQALARAAARPDPMPNAAIWSRDPPLPSGAAFSLGPATARSVEHVRDQLRRLEHLRPSLESAAKEAETLARHIRNARLASAIKVADAEDLEAAFRILLSEHQELAAQSRTAAELISDVATSMAAMAGAFEQLPPVPVDARAVAELQDLVHQLQGLYGESWERFDAVREDLRPIREELHRLRVDYLQAIEMIEQVPAAAADSVKPVVDRLYDRVSTGVDKLGDAIRKSIGQIADALDAVTMQAEDRVRLVQALWNPVSDAVAAARSIRGTFPRPHSPTPSVSDVLARLEILEARAHPPSPPLDVAVADLARRLERLETTSSGHHTAYSEASTQTSSSALSEDWRSLRDRVSKLEEQQRRISDTDRRVEIEQYLTAFGLGPDELTRLGRSSLARGNQFAFPGHTFGMSG
ncbi:hypothetical protein C8Q76DRAFT_801515 [Earliella scabrosa]|nr:hypothetical protein C8Q76DRAFT_801515 [Earliella scabrosa]